MPRNPDYCKRSVLFLLILLLAAGAAGIFCTAHYADTLLDRIHFVDPAPTLPQPEVISTGDTSLSTEPEVLSGSVNILLIGQDRLEENYRTRSDTILLCTFHHESKTLTMTSILRDLYVSIPGHGDNRINAAYAAGGMPLLRQTLEKNLGITVDGCVEVDFSGFAELIDLLGGVELELRQEEADIINKSTAGSLSEGKHLLNGKQALAYARIRKLDADGDFSRTARQRKLLTVLLETCRQSSPTTLLRLVKEALPLITTDIPRKDLSALVLELLPMVSHLEIRGQYIPAEGTYSYQTIKGMSVLVADLEKARQLLQSTLSGPAG